MRVAVTGASGLVGSALIASLRDDHHEALRLVRGAATSADEISWEPAAGAIDAARLESVDALVHLAGEGIAEKRWSDEQKRKIRESRVVGTRLVAETVAKLARKPVLVCASAIGFYGARGDEELDESAAPGTGFLADVCRAWEAAADPARAAGVRVVHARLGVVLSKKGGALAKMLTPFQMGVGGKLGTGRQWMSWISLEDVALALRHALATSSLEGPTNVVAPNPVTNAEFTKLLGHALHRPTALPMPAFAARLAFGEMADALLLTGQRVVPKRLLASGFEFRDRTLAGALDRILSN